jgi:histidinol phosphatase-like PHP family hydrolase
VFIEITAKEGHSLGNGHVVRVAKAAGAKLLLNSDSHVPGHILTEEFARKVALCAGLAETDLKEVLVTNPQALIARSLGRRS